MLDNLSERLLAPRREPGRLFDWEAIVQFSESAVITLFHHAYIERLRLGFDAHAFEGGVQLEGTSLTRHFAGVKFGPPQLSFEPTSPGNPRIGMILEVLGGSQALLETSYGQTRIVSLSNYSPQPGNAAHLKCTVIPTSDPRRVVINLGIIEDSEFEFGGTLVEQRMIGRAMAAFFSEQEESARLLKILAFNPDKQPLLTPRQIDLRLQKYEATGETSLYVLPTFDYGVGGNYPAADGRFPELVPEGSAGAAIVSSKLAHRAALGQAAFGWLEEPDAFDLSDIDAALSWMIAKKGELTILDTDGRDEVYEYRCNRFSVPLGQGTVPLRLDFENNWAKQHWRTTFVPSVQYRLVDQPIWTPVTPTFQLDFEHHFYIAPGDGAPIEAQLYPPVDKAPEISELSSNASSSTLPAGVIKFIQNLVSDALLIKLTDHMRIKSSEMLLAGLDLADGLALEPTLSAMSRDRDMESIAQLGPREASFQVVDPKTVLVPGQTVQFVTEPARAGLKWKAVLITGTHAGRIDEDTGSYRAPPPHTLVGSYSQVIVEARDPLTDERSHCLLTVTAQPLNLSTFFQESWPDQTWSLSASSFNGAKVDWAYSGAGSMEPTVNGCDYKTPLADDLSDFYTIEEVQATAADDSDKVTVLIKKDEPDLTVMVDADAVLPAGQVQLIAKRRGEPRSAEWKVLAGGGSVDAQSGVFSVSPNDTNRFAVITARSGENDDPFMGHINLLLPLSNYPGLMKKLAMPSPESHASEGESHHE
ncbi:hypothetical protein [Pseudomonas sp. R5(2019)]|uniref:hypothetical protein n=1 Tax=Pseudomonas sp. R5(2019) TaxID=2697566 RepID=UPI001412EC3C|nr:hypothetical protein [Pseudomonas sp. R5(2019)]NBA97400.1 hypothetical protein [Pseudomonas sp. R5(2019)]